jgi:hypothetical protein
MRLLAAGWWISWVAVIRRGVMLVATVAVVSLLVVEVAGAVRGGPYRDVARAIHSPAPTAYFGSNMSARIVVSPTLSVA